MKAYRQVAVIGAGPAGLTAALELLSTVNSVQVTYALQTSPMCDAHPAC